MKENLLRLHVQIASGTEFLLKKTKVTLSVGHTGYTTPYNDNHTRYPVWPAASWHVFEKPTGDLLIEVHGKKRLMGSASIPFDDEFIENLRGAGTLALHRALRFEQKQPCGRSAQIIYVGQILIDLKGEFERGPLHLLPPAVAHTELQTGLRSTTHEQLTTRTRSILARSSRGVHEVREIKELEVVVVRGFDLLQVDARGDSDPYLLLTLDPFCSVGGVEAKYNKEMTKMSKQHQALSSGVQQWRTTTKDDTISPVWNERHTFKWLEHMNDDLTRGSLKLTLMDHDTASADDPMGEATIVFDDIFCEHIRLGAWKMEVPMRLNRKAAGMIVLHMRAIQGGPIKAVEAKNSGKRTATTLLGGKVPDYDVAVLTNCGTGHCHPADKVIPTPTAAKAPPVAAPPQPEAHRREADPAPMFNKLEERQAAHEREVRRQLVGRDDGLLFPLHDEVRALRKQLEDTLGRLDALEQDTTSGSGFGRGGDLVEPVRAAEPIVEYHTHIYEMERVCSCASISVVALSILCLPHHQQMQ